jgi:hypothetical protein
MLKVGGLGIVGSQPWGTGEQASHEQVWSVTLALATIKGMVDRSNNRSIQVVKNLTSPTLMVCSSPHKFGGSGPLRDAVSIWACVGGGL